jgi:hypothetical protein
MVEEGEEGRRRGSGIEKKRGDDKGAESQPSVPDVVSQPRLLLLLLPPPPLSFHLFSSSSISLDCTLQPVTGDESACSADLPCQPVVRQQA